MSALVLYVRLHDGRYHGAGAWPPSPARLFQALVAGVGLGGPLGDVEKEALEWLEKQNAPIIAAPLAWKPGRGVLFYMPNNDTDRIEGDPMRMSMIRTATKVFRPYFFDATVPFVYAWPLTTTDDDVSSAKAICSLAERLYQFGRGIDMAWAWGEVLDDHQLDELLAKHPGRIFRPSAGRGTISLPCPGPGSFESIARRYLAYGARFRYVKDGRAVKVFLSQPHSPSFQRVPYDSPPSRQLYELRDPTGVAFAPWPLAHASALVVRLRDGAVARLKDGMPNGKAEIERVLVGRKPVGTNDGPPENRVRIIPLPSIGHVHADREIRRVLIEVPPTCPIRPDDVHWAFSGLDVRDTETGEVQAALIRTDDQGFLRHYGLEDDRRHQVWRTVTPAALPEDARRRRIDPARKGDEAKDGCERAAEQARAANAVCQALRHAGLRTGVEAIRVQREPFESNGARVEAFADGTRFAKERLWHVEVTFKAPVSGPLVIGDGRFLGLGVMAPLKKTVGIHVLAIESGMVGTPEPEDLARALRRAVMARVQEVRGGDNTLPVFFSGHQPDGGPAREAGSSHLAFTCDLARSRLIIVAPHVLDRRDPTREERDHLAALDEALEALSELRAGPAGCLVLRRAWIDADTDPLTAPSHTWESETSYVVTRHSRMGDASKALSADLIVECRRRSLPVPRDTIVLETKGVAGTGLSGRARLSFATAVRGPLLLGRNRHLGGGLFRAIQANAAE